MFRRFSAHAPLPAPTEDTTIATMFPDPPTPPLLVRRPSPLRDALIDAGLALLAEDKALTLRRCAARAGVSHAAPAHHFDGLRGLLTAIAARAFTEFEADLRAAAEAAGADPFARLSALCGAYLAFARDRDPLFRLMFAGPDIDFSDVDLAPRAAAAYGRLRDACAPFAASPAAAAAIETAVWSLVHGHAALSRDSLLREAPGGRPEVPFEQMLALLALQPRSEY